MKNLTGPALSRILETVLYCRTNNYEETLCFYDDVLGLRDCRLFRDKPGIYRPGNSILLIFNTDETSRKQSPPPTGTSGRGHVCFEVLTGRYDDWKAQIAAADVEIIDEIAWSDPLTGRSFYCHDPAGNVVEFADRDIWPQPGVIE